MQVLGRVSQSIHLMGLNNFIKRKEEGEKKPTLPKRLYSINVIRGGGRGSSILCAGMNTDLNHIKIPVLNLKF
jgi:hypothetical protein